MRKLSSTCSGASASAIDSGVPCLIIRSSKETSEVAEASANGEGLIDPDEAMRVIRKARLVKRMSMKISNNDNDDGRRMTLPVLGEVTVTAARIRSATDIVSEEKGEQEPEAKAEEEEEILKEVAKQKDVHMILLVRRI